MKIAVGSTNIVKVNAVRKGTEHMWPDAQIFHFETESGVGHQPMSDEETRIGSINRAVLALNMLEQIENDTLFDTKQPSLGIGLEGGVDPTSEGLMNVVWCSVVDNEGVTVSSSGARFLLPKIIAQRILDGEEMGPVMDSLVQDKDVKKKQGMIGVVTSGFFSRMEEYASISRLTIGLWYGRHWQESL